MIETSLLFTKVFLLFLMMIPGFLVRKTGICQESAQSAFSSVILYVTTPAMIVVSFVRAFDRGVLITCLWVLLFSFAAHLLFFALTLPFFRKERAEAAKVYRFGVIFANSGYMGIPLIISLFGDQAAIYASFYVVGFNFFMWSLGALIYTGDRSYISPRKMFVNPATIPTYIGLLIFLLPIEGTIPGVVVDALSALRDTVAPMSMMLIGMQLANVKLKGIVSGGLLLSVALRLFACPILLFGLLKLLAVVGVYSDPTGAYVSFICASAPAAAATGIFAEKFNGDRECAGKVVAITTILSVLTMPVAAMVLKLY